LVEALDPEVVRDLKEKVEKAGPGLEAKSELALKVQSLGDEEKAKFTEFA
jgi:hypothetical protein